MPTVAARNQSTILSEDQVRSAFATAPVRESQSPRTAVSQADDWSSASSRHAPFMSDQPNLLTMDSSAPALLVDVPLLQVARFVLSTVRLRCTALADSP